MRVVGHRRADGDGWMDAGRLSRTASFLRGDAALVPRGVFRFATFDEADAWMTRMMIATRERRSRVKWSASAER